MNEKQLDKKKIVYVIEYEVDADQPNIEYVLDSMREYGSANIVDVKVK